MCTAHKPVSKLLGKGDFKAFCPAGEHTAPMGWKWLSHAKFHPNTDLWCANFYFNNDMFCKQSNEVESRYLQNKVTSLQIESSCWAAGRASGLNWVLGYWHGYLSAARCEWFAWCHCHPIISCSSKIRMVYLSGAGLPRLSWKKGAKWM